MGRKNITLTPLTDHDREAFILDNQRAFLFGATEEFGLRDDHFEEEGEIISRKTIEESIDGGAAFRICENGRVVGGLVLSFPEGEDRGSLDLLFVDPLCHSRGIGLAAWRAVEEMYPNVAIWETVTPYFETRNIHFYINKCGFHAVEFFNAHHSDPNDPEPEEEGGGMFRFEKRMK